jgi:micrococcal nuclease
MKSVLVFLFACLILPAISASDETLHGTVGEVIDGNTILIHTLDGEEYKVYLHGIDSPEPGQQYAEQSKKFLEKLLLKKRVTIVMHGKDRLGNRLGIIQVDGASDPRHELVKAGLAWTSEKEPLPELEALKEEARQNNKGLWEDDNPTPPWVYRRQQSMAGAKSG